MANGEDFRLLLIEFGVGFASRWPGAPGAIGRVLRGNTQYACYDMYYHRPRLLISLCFALTAPAQHGLISEHLGTAVVASPALFIAK